MTWLLLIFLQGFPQKIRVCNNDVGKALKADILKQDPQAEAYMRGKHMWVQTSRRVKIRFKLKRGKCG